MKTSQGVVLVLAAVFLAVASVGAQDRGLEVAARAAAGTDVKIGKQYVVLIAIDKYREWTPLRTPVRDAKAIKEILTRRYYVDEFMELYDDDATAVGVRTLFARLVDTIGPTDSVLIYYAGHGYTDRFQTGFWIPVDGGKDVTAQEHWIPNQQIRNFIAQMKARSVALVSDSCFSGDLLNVQRGAVPVVDAEYFRNALRFMARQVLTSGASETVPDESEFSRQFKTFLETNTEPYVDPLMMYERVRRGVTKTLPLFGTLPGQETGGSFVLFLKTAPSTATAPMTPTMAATTSGGTVGTGDAELLVAIHGATKADLYVNGVKVGSVPSLIQKVPSGVPLTVEARSGYDSGTVELTLGSRELREISIALVRQKGNLFVESAEKAVDVWLDGTRLGLLGTGLFRGLSAGEHVLELKGAGLYYGGDIVVPANETVRISAAAEAVGSIRVDAPAGASITVKGPDGTSRSVTGSATLTNTKTGSYTVTAGGVGWAGATATLSVRQGETTTWMAYTTGTVQLSVNPTGARLLVDDRELAAVPALSLAPGLHRFALSAPGYYEQTSTVNVELGKLYSLSISLVAIAKASLIVPDPPLGADISVAGMSGTVDESGTIRVDGVPTGLPVRFTVNVFFADSLESLFFDQEMTFSEGEKRTLRLASGSFSLPWLPTSATLYFTPVSAPQAGDTGSIPVPLTRIDGGWRSPPLAFGTYTVTLDGSYPYSSTIAITSDQVVELPGYRTSMIAVLEGEKTALELQVATLTGRVKASRLALVTGLVGGAGAIIAYALGDAAYLDYQAADTITSASAARDRIELWGAVFPVYLSFGVLGLGLSPILRSGTTNMAELQQAIEVVNAALLELRRQ